MKAADLQYAACAEPDEAVARLAAAQGMAKVCAGTQSLGPMMNLRLAQPALLVDVSRMPALTRSGLRDGRLVTGAAITHARFEDGEGAAASRGLLPQVAAGIAYRAVRNRGTLGGSLAHADPAADWVSTACLLDAGIHLVGPGGSRRVPASEFFLAAFTTALADDELIVEVDWPVLSPQARWAYRKLCRKPGEFAEAMVAIWTDPSQGISRLVIGALDGAPAIVSGEAAVNALRERAGQTALFDAIGLDDPYRRQLQSVMLARAFAQLDARPGPETTP